MEGYVRDGRLRRLAVEPLEERALLSSSGLFDHLLPSALPAAAPRLPAQAAALSDSLAAADPALKALSQPELVLLVGRVETMPQDGRAAQAFSTGDHGAAPNREGPVGESLEREVNEALRAVMLKTAAVSAADVRFAIGGEPASRTALHPPAAQAAPRDSPLPPAMPGREADSRRGAGGLCRGEGGEVPAGAAAVPGGADAPSGRGARGEDALEAAPAPPAGPAATASSLAPAALLEVGLPFDLPVLKQEVDEFFARLADLGAGGAGWHACTHFGPWLVVMSAGAFEVARRWEKKSARRTAPGDEVVVGPAALLTEDE